MKAVFPTAYFGSIAHFNAIIRSDKEVFIESYEYFVKQSLRSRCRILTANGIIDLSVPLIKPDGNKTLIKDVLVDDSKNWRDIHWKSIKSAYSSAPYFEHYAPIVESTIYQNNLNLLNINNSITKIILKLLDFSTEIRGTEQYELQNFPENEILCSKQLLSSPEAAPYIQVFPGKASFTMSLSVLDVLFCEGPLAHNLFTNT